jgi:hypothetical protein
MNISYKRNGTKTYLVAKKEGAGESDFREKMLTRNKIRYMAKMQPQVIDGCTFYYYDIQGKVSLSAVYAGKNMNCQEILHFLQALSVFFSETERYMLLPEEVIFDPDAIWLSPDTLDPEFIYVPGMKPDSSCSIEKLALFLTEHTDCSDREAAEYAYSYMETVENGYYLPHVTPPRDTPVRETDNSPTDPYDDPAGIPDISCDEAEMSALFEKQTSDAKRVYICLGIAGIAAIGYVLLVLYPSLFPFYLNENEYMILGVGIAVIFALVLISVMHVYNKKGLQDERIQDDVPREILPAADHIQESSYPVTDTGFCTEQDYPASQTYSVPDNDRTVLLKGPKPHRQALGCPVLLRDGGGSILLAHFPFIVGKMKDRVDEVISDEGISRIHAMIKEKDGKYFISDLNSLNGTGVNGRMLDANETAEISDGDRVSLAGSSFTFRLA